MGWRKLGQLFHPESEHPKLRSHAANPLAVLLGGDVYRVFYSGRDAGNRSSVGAVDIDMARYQIVQRHAAPFFQHGEAGSFYEAGVSVGCHYHTERGEFILFMGWQNPPQGHWRGDIGRLRLSDQGAKLTLAENAPLLGMDATDPISLSYPWVLPDGNGYRMWYGSTLQWDAGNGEMLHVLQQASSPDGEQWQREGLAVPYALGEAQAFSRPTVIRDTNGGLHMWYSYRSGRGETYRIGYAHSPDGYNWQRQDDQSGIAPSVSGWDSEMICYPYVFVHAGQRYMLYNGNGYGRTGFGLALWESAE